MGIHQADIGTQFELTVLDQDSVAVDLSTASVKQVVFKKPSGAVVAKTASFLSTGVDGKLKYVTVNGDLDEVGEWTAQGVVTIGTSQWHTDTFRFTVYANLS